MANASQSPTTHLKSIQIFDFFVAMGVLSNVLNPKTALFYLALLPQFTHFDDQVLVTSLLLASIHIAMRFTWLLLITILIQRTREFHASFVYKAEHGSNDRSGAMHFSVCVLALARRE